MSSRRVRAGLVAAVLLASGLVQAPLTGMPAASAEGGSAGALTVQVAATTPGAPKIGKPTPGNRSAVAYWAAPSSNGGSPITGYVIRVYRGSTYVKAMAASASARRLTVTGLTNRVTYNFDISARSAVGTGIASTRSAAVTPLGTPDAPTIGAPIKGNNAAVVQWAAPANNGGFPITGYVIRVYRGATYVKAASAGATARRLTVSGLTNGVTYTMNISARNTRGVGPASMRSSAVTPGAPAPKPAPTVGQSNALRSAQSYIDIMPFSRAGLIEQLSYEGYSLADATYAVSNVRVNWNEEAAEAARNYLEFMGFSRAGLIDQLIYEEFTQAQAEYGANAVGLW